MSAKEELREIVRRIAPTELTPQQRRYEKLQSDHTAYRRHLLGQYRRLKTARDRRLIRDLIPFASERDIGKLLEGAEAFSIGRSFGCLRRIAMRIAIEVRPHEAGFRRRLRYRLAVLSKKAQEFLDAVADNVEANSIHERSFPTASRNSSTLSCE